MAGQYSLSDLSGVLGGDLYSSLFSDNGFTGNYGLGGWEGENPWMTGGGSNETGNTNWLPIPNQAANKALDGYSFNWTPTEGEGGTLQSFDSSGKAKGNYTQKDEDMFTKLVAMAAPAIASWGFGGALTPMFGGGAMGGALGYGTASGAMSSMQGGSFADGFLSGAIGGGLQGLGAGTPEVMGNNPSAYVPAQPGTTLAGAAGITNPTLAGMFNRGVGSTLGGLASGKTGQGALQGGLLGAGLSGLNSMGAQGMSFVNNAFNTLMPSGGDGLDSLMGSGGDMSGVTDVTQNSYDEASPSYRYSGDQTPNMGFSMPMSAQEMPQKQMQQASGESEGFLPSFVSNMGSRLGNFASNNMGDLASMLYGFYNNRRQQQALQGQIQGLQGLYSANSPYATQLRNQLNAKAAASGRRSNISGRETQLQAMLADRAAQTMPTQFQIQQAQNSLKNNNMNMLLQGFNKVGGFDALGQGLRGMFGPQSSLTGPGSLNAYTNMDNMYGTVG